MVTPPDTLQNEKESNFPQSFSQPQFSPEEKQGKAFIIER